MMNDLRKVAQVSTDTKSAIGGTRMSEAATPAVAAGNRVSTTRIVGATAIAVAALVLIDNVMVGWVDSPTYGAPLKEVLAFHADHRAAVATLSAVMAFYAVLWDGVVLSAGELTEPSPVLELAWQMHAAAFAWSLPALGATFIGAALATHASRLTPPWQRLLAAAGGSLLLVAGGGDTPPPGGPPPPVVGVAGLAAWLVWLVVTGLRLIRGR